MNNPLFNDRDVKLLKMEAELPLFQGEMLYDFRKIKGDYRYFNECHYIVMRASPFKEVRIKPETLELRVGKIWMKFPMVTKMVDLYIKFNAGQSGKEYT